MYIATATCKECGRCCLWLLLPSGLHNHKDIFRFFRLTGHYLRRVTDLYLGHGGEDGGRSFNNSETPSFSHHFYLYSYTIAKTRGFSDIQPTKKLPVTNFHKIAYSKN